MLAGDAAAVSLRAGRPRSVPTVSTVIGLVPAAVSLDAGRALLLSLAGFGAGVFNGVAGGGTMLSFPALLALGYPALTANVTSTVGIWPGYAGGVVGFMPEIRSQRERITSLAPVAMVGAVGGAALLLTTSQATFALLAPWLVFAATALFAFQPLLRKLFGEGVHEHPARRRLLVVGTFLASLYGGYFGAAMGVLLLAVFGLALPDNLAHSSGLRAALSVLVNGVAALVFVARAHLAWEAVGLLAAGSLVGGWVGAGAARRLPAVALRVLVVAIGAATAAKLLAG
jgi:uncharacterized protein